MAILDGTTRMPSPHNPGFIHVRDILIFSRSGNCQGVYVVPGKMDIC